MAGESVFNDWILGTGPYPPLYEPNAGYVVHGATDTEWEKLKNEAFKGALERAKEQEKKKEKERQALIELINSLG